MFLCPAETNLSVRLSCETFPIACLAIFVSASSAVLATSRSQYGARRLLITLPFACFCKLQHSPLSWFARHGLVPLPASGSRRQLRYEQWALCLRGGILARSNNGHRPPTRTILHRIRQAQFCARRPVSSLAWWGVRRFSECNQLSTLMRPNFAYLGLDHRYSKNIVRLAFISLLVTGGNTPEVAVSPIFATN